MNTIISEIVMCVSSFEDKNYLGRFIVVAGTVIVGGGVGGLRCAEQLRRNGYRDPIRIVSEETKPPYDRPHLSKGVLVDKEPPEPQFLTSVDKLWEADIELLYDRATALDRESKQVSLTDGKFLNYDHLVVASGAVPVKLPILARYENVYTLRKWEDALRIREVLGQRVRVLVVGAGVLGLEVAASARSRGCDVEVIDLAPIPIPRLGGPDFGESIADLHRNNGVSIRLGVSITDVTSTNTVVRSVTLSDGARLSADIVIVAIGARPAVRWLQGSGLLDDGELRSHVGYKTKDPWVYAIGDSASVLQPDGSYLRHEHFTNAVDSARISAQQIIEESTGEVNDIPQELPYFWSDQFGVKIQILGRINSDEPLKTVVEDGSMRRLQVSSRNGQVTGVVSWNMPGALNRCRRSLMGGVSAEELLRTEPWVKKVAS